jgi:hypothetical protein
MAYLKVIFKHSLRENEEKYKNSKTRFTNSIDGTVILPPPSKAKYTQLYLHAPRTS